MKNRNHMIKAMSHRHDPPTRAAGLAWEDTVSPSTMCGFTHFVHKSAKLLKLEKDAKSGPDTRWSGGHIFNLA